LKVDGGEWVVKHLVRKLFGGVKPESDFGMFLSAAARSRTLAACPPEFGTYGDSNPKVLV
jgi:hypothetical protein